MAGQATRIKKEAKAKAAAKKRVAEAVAEAKASTYEFTAEDITKIRDGEGLSWADVAKRLKLKSPGAARKAYTALTGRPHNESVMTGRKRAARSSASSVRVVLEWNDDSDQDDIMARLNGMWVEAIGEPGSKNYQPAHWSGSHIVVRRTMYGNDTVEELRVAYCTRFSFGKNGDQPLSVEVVDRDTGATRQFFVKDIVEVM